MNFSVLVASLTGIALYSVRFYAVHFTNENSNPYINVQKLNRQLCQFIYSDALVAVLTIEEFNYNFPSNVA